MNITNQCKQCGKDFHPSNRGKRGRETKFCGMTCVLLWQKENYHHTMRNGQTKTCPICGKSFYLRKGLLNQIYCNRICFGISEKNIPHTEESKIKASISMAQHVASGKFNPKTNCKHGYYTSSISGKSEYYNSSYELVRMKQLDNMKCMWTKRHGIRIQYINSNGVRRYYAPDFLINNSIIEEVKPNSLIGKDNNPEKFAAAIQYCNNQKMKFNIVTEKELGIKI